MDNILLLHGAIGAKDQLIPLQGRLKDQFNVYTMSFVGHGERADDGHPFSMSHFANDVIAFLDDNNIQKINIFGYSMGGYVALYLAKFHPERVNNIITLGTKFKWNSEIASKESALLSAEKIQLKVPKFAQILEHRHSGSDWKKVLRKTQELLSALGEQNSLELEDYTSINHQVKILLADQDDMVSEKESEAVSEQLPNGTFSYLKNSFHPIEKVDMDELIKHF